MDPSPQRTRTKTNFTSRLILSVICGLPLACGSDSSSSSGGTADVARVMQFDASNLLHGYIPTEGQFVGKVSALNSSLQSLPFANGALESDMTYTTVVWMKDATPYQTGLMKFSTPSSATAWSMKLQTLPEGIVCAPTPDPIDFTPGSSGAADEFDETGTRVVKGNCVYNVETSAAFLPSDLVLLVNGTEVTIPASSAGESSFNIPLSSLTEINESTWLPSSGVDRPQFVTDNWSAIEKRSIVEDITQLKKVTYRDLKYTIKIKDTASPCTITNGEAIMATQYHGEVSVTTGSQLVTPALMKWDATARKKLIIDCAGNLTPDATSIALDNDENKEKTLTLTNSGGRTITLGSMADADLGLAAPYSKKTTSTCATGATLAVKASCTLVIAFAPTAAGATSDSLTISYTDLEESKTTTVAIAGEALDMKISPVTYTFESVAANQAATLKQFTITNLSAGTVTLGNFSSSAELGLAAPFYYQNGDTSICYGGKVLAIGALCTIKVGVNSASAGTFSDALVMPYVTSTSVSGSVSAAVTGTVTP